MAALDEGRMTTAIDTNVVIALWDKDATLSLAAQNALDAAYPAQPFSNTLSA